MKKKEERPLPPPPPPPPSPETVKDMGRALDLTKDEVGGCLDLHRLQRSAREGGSAGGVWSTKGAKASPRRPPRFRSQSLPDEIDMGEGEKKKKGSPRVESK